MRVQRLVTLPGLQSKHHVLFCRCNLHIKLTRLLLLQRKRGCLPMHPDSHEDAQLIFCDENSVSSTAAASRHADVSELLMPHGFDFSNCADIFAKPFDARVSSKLSMPLHDISSSEAQLAVGSGSEEHNNRLGSVSLPSIAASATAAQSRSVHSQTETCDRSLQVIAAAAASREAPVHRQRDDEDRFEVTERLQ